MEPQSPPPKIACLADHDFLAISGTRNSCGLEMNNKGPINGGGGSSPTGLGLGLELGRSDGSSNRHGCSKSSGFTFLQLQELEHQALIYNYIEAGLSVPCHLLLPIWKSVASSLTGLNSDLQQQYYPRLVAGLGSFHHDYKNSMEPEPGRCRRTDGKKWRCSKDVVPNHKYCERHIHRGRHRSRKRVEAPPQLATTASSNPTSRDVQLSNTNL